jgi:23S rRNA-/tRNA-specific pseudouridylate synthase
LIHHSVVCDPLYSPGEPAELGFTRLALHAYRLTLNLPSGTKQTFEAPLPDDFVLAEKALS